MSSVLLLSNQDVEKLLTIEDTIRALDEAYLELDKGQTANRPRTFTFSPTNTGRFVANTHEGIIRAQGVYDIRVVTHSRPDPTIDPYAGREPPSRVKLYSSVACSSYSC